MNNNDNNEVDPKLDTVINALSEWLQEAEVVCNKGSSSRKDTAYRSRCTYQVVWSDVGDEMNFAKRVNQQAVPLVQCPHANTTIRRAMENIRHFFNNHPRDSSSLRSCLQRGLQVISFSSSWEEDSDVLVTLNYSTPLGDLSAWKAEARDMLEYSNVKQVTGRSKKRIVRALDAEEATWIRDTLYLLPRPNQLWDVCVGKTGPEARISPKTDSESTIPVHYVKPEDAFSHPNAHVMVQALGWILSRIAMICRAQPNHSFRLAELYCGYGAHTMAILQAKIENLASITAVELDKRLVEALHRNVGINDTTNITTKLEIVQADANKWSRRQQLVEPGNPLLYDIVLVDPPRQGLDVNVTKLLVENKHNIAHCLYISCGSEALARDLKLLTRTYRVHTCLVLDLFPQTSSVETLLHLVRREAS